MTREGKQVAPGSPRSWISGFCQGDKGAEAPIRQNPPKIPNKHPSILQQVSGDEWSIRGQTSTQGEEPIAAESGAAALAAGSPPGEIDRPRNMSFDPQTDTLLRGIQEVRKRPPPTNLSDSSSSSGSEHNQTTDLMHLAKLEVCKRQLLWHRGEYVQHPGCRPELEILNAVEDEANYIVRTMVGKGKILKLDSLSIDHHNLFPDEELAREVSNYVVVYKSFWRAIPVHVTTRCTGTTHAFECCWGQHFGKLAALPPQQDNIREFQMFKKLRIDITGSVEKYMQNSRIDTISGFPNHCKEILWDFMMSDFDTYGGTRIPTPEEVESLRRETGLLAKTIDTYFSQAAVANPQTRMPDHPDSIYDMQKRHAVILENFALSNLASTTSVQPLDRKSLKEALQDTMTSSEINKWVSTWRSRHRLNIDLIKEFNLRPLDANNPLLSRRSGKSIGKQRKLADSLLELREENPELDAQFNINVKAASWTKSTQQHLATAQISPRQQIGDEDNIEERLQVSWPEIMALSSDPESENDIMDLSGFNVLSLEANSPAHDVGISVEMEFKEDQEPMELENEPVHEVELLHEDTLPPATLAGPIIPGGPGDPHAKPETQPPSQFRGKTESSRGAPDKINNQKRQKLDVTHALSAEQTSSSSGATSKDLGHAKKEANVENRGSSPPQGQSVSRSSPQPPRRTRSSHNRSFDSGDPTTFRPSPLKRNSRDETAPQEDLHPPDAAIGLDLPLDPKVDNISWTPPTASANHVQDVEKWMIELIEPEPPGVNQPVDPQISGGSQGAGKWDFSQFVLGEIARRSNERNPSPVSWEFQLQGSDEKIEGVEERQESSLGLRGFLDDQPEPYASLGSHDPYAPAMAPRRVQVDLAPINPQNVQLEAGRLGVPDLGQQHSCPNQHMDMAGLDIDIFDPRSPDFRPAASQLSVKDISKEPQIGNMNPQNLLDRIVTDADTLKELLAEVMVDSFFGQMLVTVVVPDDPDFDTMPPLYLRADRTPRYTRQHPSLMDDATSAKQPTPPESPRQSPDRDRVVDPAASSVSFGIPLPKDSTSSHDQRREDPLLSSPEHRGAEVSNSMKDGGKPRDVIKSQNRVPDLMGSTCNTETLLPEATYMNKSPALHLHPVTSPSDLASIPVTQNKMTRGGYTDVSDVYIPPDLIKTFEDNGVLSQATPVPGKLTKLIDINPDGEPGSPKLDVYFDKWVFGSNLLTDVYKEVDSRVKSPEKMVKSMDNVWHIADTLKERILRTTSSGSGRALDKTSSPVEQGQGCAGSPLASSLRAQEVEPTIVAPQHLSLTDQTESASQSKGRSSSAKSRTAFSAPVSPKRPRSSEPPRNPKMKREPSPDESSMVPRTDPEKTAKFLLAKFEKSIELSKRELDESVAELAEEMEQGLRHDKMPVAGAKPSISE